MNVSGIVIQAEKGRVDEVISVLRKGSLCDVFFHDPRGRIIVTLEGEYAEEEIRKVLQLERIPHVISVNLAYAYSEEELDRAREKFKKRGGDVPDVLKDDSVRAEEIVYHGDLKRKMH
ncbi:MAG: chaperone NapD [Deltaproteobacteria bacterium]|nr:chaperone NapD [Deltaproteobacteria bacterium]